MLVGPISSDIRKYTDISDYTTASGAFVIANEQTRPKIPFEEFMRAVYEEEPVSALRSMLVDKYGDTYRTDNPLPVQLSSGSISIGTVNGELEVQLSRQDDNPDAGDIHDSVRIGNQNGEMTYTANDDSSKFAADIVMLNKLINVPHNRTRLIRNASGDIETVEIYDSGNLKQTFNLVYDANEDLIDVVEA